MSKSKTFTVRFKRKRNGRTNYGKRIKYIASKRPRLVIRPSLKNIVIQLVEFGTNGDHVLFTIKSVELKKFGWKYSTGNIPAAYLTGLLIGIKGKTKIKEAIVDFGLNSVVAKTRVYAAIKGVLDAGIKVPCSNKVLPDNDLISGKKISDFSSLIHKKEGYEKQFSNLLKEGIDPKSIEKNFEEVKNKILKK